MANARGTVLIPRIKYLKMRHAWDDLVAALKPETRTIVTGSVLPGSWYPFDAFVDLVVQADEMFGDGDLALSKEMGRFAATANLSTVLRFLVRLSTPKTLLGKGAALWHLHHDTGKASATMHGERGAFYEIKDFGAPHRALCAAVEGWIERSLELTGVKDIIVVERDCAARSGSVCLYQAVWDP